MDAEIEESGQMPGAGVPSHSEIPPAAPAAPDQTAQGLEQHPATKGLPFNLFVTAVEIGGSIALFHLAKSRGASDVVSYLVGSIAPLIGALMIWVKARKFSGASAAIFCFTIVSALIALAGSTNAKALLYKDCATTALIGLVFLGSCVLARKPLVFYFAQRYGTDGTHEGMSIFDAMWVTSHEFRQSMYFISYLWAGLFLIQAAGTALIIREESYSSAYNYDQTLPFVAIALGLVGSMAIGRHFAKKGNARAASGDTGASSATGRL